jgi:uncharacterized protein
MPRPRKPCTCSCPDRLALKAVFKPAGTPLGMLECVTLYHDELEALHLCDGQGKTQEEAGVCMGVSRGTVQRLLSQARRKVAETLVKQQALAINGRENSESESSEL